MPIIVTEPRELDYRATIAGPDAIVEAGLQGAHDQTSATVALELDPRRLEQINRVLAPEIGLDDVPAANEAHGCHIQGSSTSPRSAAMTAAAMYFAGSIPCSLAVSRIV